MSEKYHEEHRYEDLEKGGHNINTLIDGAGA
jgi:hypothetical protein